MKPYDGAEQQEVALKSKYAALSNKYAQLVERLDRRDDERVDIFRLGYLGLQGSGQALALVKSDSITMASNTWRHLARVVAAGRQWTALTGAGKDETRSYRDLSTLVRREAGLLLKSRQASAMAVLRFESARSNRTLEVRLERMGRESSAQVLAAAHDATRELRLQAEMSSSREALLTRERLRILGVLAASVAHDLGTTLRAAVLHLEPLRRDPAVQRAHVAGLRQLGRALEIANETVGRLHSFASAGQLLIGSVDLRTTVQDAIAVVKLSIGPKPRVRIACELPALPRVRGSAGELSHLFVNLLLNAVEAMPEGGVVKVTARRDGERVLVTVEDNGVGVASDDLTRLFEPFFTTKGPSGTGLGLWLAASTMRRIGGSIGVDSMPGEGTRFRMLFPIASSWRASGDEPAQPAAPAPPRAAASRAPAAPGARRRASGRRTARRS